MSYNSKVLENRETEYEYLKTKLQELIRGICFSTIDAGNEKSEEYLIYGAGRRLQLIQRCFSNVFDSFPPNRKTQLSIHALDSVEISLQSFIINLHGLFDNLAWAYIFRHKLEDEITDKRKVGLFLKSTQKYLPLSLKTYLTSRSITEWHDSYLKNYRDALAHRIPLYIPQRILTKQEKTRFEELQKEKIQCLRFGKDEQLKKIQIELTSLGSASSIFLYSAEESPMQLHSQMLCDVMTVLEIGNIFLSHWHERS